MLQLDYYTLETPTHWTTIRDVHDETYTLKGLDPLTTAIVVVRARNQHGLSPPSPMSKPMTTTASNGDDLLLLTDANGDLITDPRVARSRLEARTLELKEAVVVGSRKVKLLWEVSGLRCDMIGLHSYSSVKPMQCYCIIQRKSFIDRIKAVVI